MREHRKLLIVVVILAAGMGIFAAIGLRFSATQAQNDPLPLPADESSSSVVQQIDADSGLTSVTTGDLPDWAQAELDAARAEYAQFQHLTLHDYNLLYLVDSSAVAPDSFVSPQNLSKQGNFQIASNWNEVLRLNNEQLPQVLIIHKSAVNSVDHSWLQSAYRRGVIIVGINIPFTELAQMIGDRCEYAKAATTYEEEYFIAFSYILAPQREEDREAINQGILEECKDPNFDYQYHYSVLHSELQNMEGADYFNGAILGELTAAQVYNAKAKN